MSLRGQQAHPWNSYADIRTGMYVKPVWITSGAQNITTLFANLAAASWNLRGKRLKSFWMPLAMAVKKQIGKYFGRCKKFSNALGALGMQMREELNRRTLT
jgi:hypothetical protein